MKKLFDRAQKVGLRHVKHSLFCALTAEIPWGGDPPPPPTYIRQNGPTRIGLKSL